MGDYTMRDCYGSWRVRHPCRADFGESIRRPGRLIAAPGPRL